MVVLRSEIPSGMCAKLRTMAASNNRDHARNLSYYCLLAPRIYNGVILHAHPVRGESHNQRNTTGEVASVECNISQSNHITYDGSCVRPSNCCVHVNTALELLCLC